ncbi:MAG: glycosyltransferase family 2 protein [Candidatus Portnoybacteria bacterium]
MENLDFSIVLPAYNESENLPDVLRGLKRVLGEANIQSEIIVVDNGSRDNTEETLELLKREIDELKTFRIEKNIGFGNGIIKGLEMAKGSILGFMVSDAQIKPEDLVNVYQRLKKNNLDFCKGFRINRYSSLSRVIMSKVYNFLIRLMFGCSIKDINGSPKVFTRNFYEIVKPQSKDFFIDAEILIKAKQNKFSVTEVPVVLLERKRGRSSVSILTPFGFLRSMFYRFLFGKFR